MKTVAEVIGVSRSNLIERLQERPKPRIGRPPLPNDELVAEIKSVNRRAADLRKDRGGTWEIPRLTTGQVPTWSASGRRGAVADDARTWEVGQVVPDLISCSSIGAGRQAACYNFVDRAWLGVETAAAHGGVWV